MSEAEFAKHVLSSIRNELNLLKTHNYIQPHAYDEILRLLPSNITNHQRDMPNMGGYSSNPPPFPGSMMPGSSPTHSTASIPSTPATVIPPPSYNASSNEHNKLGSVEALYDYSGGNPDADLSFRRGDIIQLTETVNDDWWKGTLHGKNGIFPRSYVKKLEPVVTEKPSYSSPPPPPPSRQSQQDSYGYSSMPPKQDSYDYPPPPPAQNSSYAPPPQSQSYAPPPSDMSNYSAQQQYAAPPEQRMANYNTPPPLTSTSSAPAVVEQPHEESKISGFGKKLAGNVANAATWGFGATIGGNVANSIF